MQIVSLINVPCGAYIWTILMLKILQAHLLRAFVANLKIDAIYALYPESFCKKNSISGKFSLFLTLTLGFRGSAQRFQAGHRLFLLSDMIITIPCVFTPTSIYPFSQIAEEDTGG